ncbi:MAG: hypothetical protein JWM12_2346 [Ilumatobacteraceae bacterium]|nr:hypothetical protein [Ilumatobacteraceae bacterium]
MRPAAFSAARAGAVAAVLTLGACASTTYDSSIPSDPPAKTTTTLPSGDADTLLPRLVTVAASLSSEITGAGDKTAVADQIVSLWNASKQEVAKNRPELLGDFEANVTRCTNAARFNRAADADKAFKNFLVLVAAYFGTTSTTTTAT